MAGQKRCVMQYCRVMQLNNLSGDWVNCRILGPGDDLESVCARLRQGRNFYLSTGAMFALEPGELGTQRLQRYISQHSLYIWQLQTADGDTGFAVLCSTFGVVFVHVLFDDDTLRPDIVQEALRLLVCAALPEAPMQQFGGVHLVLPQPLDPDVEQAVIALGFDAAHGPLRGGPSDLAWFYMYRATFDAYYGEAEAASSL